MKAAYYNEHDKFAAGWLRELIKAGVIADGEVDERDIQEVQPGDLRGFTQCHFFAGVGVWSYALRTAGWPDDTPVWTGSCPCQSFSASGKRGGFDDPRHLWPAWFRLIRECRPGTIFGEQVASKDGLAWLDVVSADLEGAGYAIGAADLCAAGFGAPHIRQRLYFVADALQSRTGWPTASFACSDKPQDRVPRANSSDGRVADADRGSGFGGEPQPIQRPIPQGSDGVLALADAPDEGFQGDRSKDVQGRGNELPAQHGYTNGFWAEAEWLWCRDQKYRPVEPGTFPLASGTANRVGRLRGYGNALCAEVAKGFIEAYLESKI
jgi:DNA (cytosine-5)-methyltransferase 1